jgi:hypothetical protein
VPTVRPVAVIVVLPQNKDVNAPHVPERTCTLTCAGPDDIVIISVAACATNLYHTSSLSDAPQPGDGNEDGFHVAFAFVPAVLTQDVEEFRVIAFEHSSLAGAWLKDPNDIISPNNKRTEVA